MVRRTAIVAVVLAILLIVVDSRPIDGDPGDPPSTSSSSPASSTEHAIGATAVTNDPATSSTTEGVPTIERDSVTLAIPDELFASTANLTLRLRDLLGQLLLRSVARLAKIVRFAQPLFGNSLVVQIPKDLE